MTLSATPSTGTPPVLIVYAHPADQVSRVNRTLLDAAQQQAPVRVHPLYTRYPDFFIDVRHEQSLLLDAEVVVLQHPLYWYSVPALLKEWIDLVLEHGWAYGAGSTQLRGKVWTHAFSTGGPAESYTSNGINRHAIEDYLRPLEQTARLCGMRWQAPFVAHGARALDDAGLQAKANRYAEWLKQLAVMAKEPA